MRRLIMKLLSKVWLLGIFLLPFVVYAQQDATWHSKRQFRTISIDQGLSQSTVYAIAQDRLGYIWMGTQDGLNRYDGRAFQIFRPIKGDTTTLASEYIRCLLVDEKDRLWVGGNKGISLFDDLKECFINYRLKGKSGEWFITSIVHDAKGLWASGSGGELYRYENEKNGFHELDIHADQFRIKNIWHIAVWGESLLLGSDNGLFEFDPKTKKIQKCVFDPKIKVNYIFVDNKILWVGTEGGGVYAYNTENGAIQHYTHILGFIPSSLADNDVRSIAKDAEGNIWVGTFKGLSVIHGKHGTIQSYYHQAAIPYTLSQNSVRYIYRDRQNGMWMGTFYGGVSYYHDHDVLFNFLSRSIGSLSLNDQVVNVVKEDAKGNIWIGTNDKGLNFWNRSTGTVRYYLHNEQEAQSLASDNIKAIEFDQKGNVYIGTHNTGLSLLDVNSGKIRVWRHKPEDAASIAGDMVYALLRDKKGRIWVGTRMGLDRFHEDTHTFTHYYLDSKGARLSSDEITTLAEDGQGRIWIGTTNGVNVLYPEQQVFDTYQGLQLSNDVVTSIAQDHKGRVWVATRDGLNLYDEKHKRFIPFRDKGNVLKGIIYGIIAGDKGDLWISLSNVLVKFDPDQGQVQTFDLRDGVQNTQFSLAAVDKTKDGMMLFGGINGLTYFYPREVSTTLLKLRLAFTGLDILNKRAVVGDSHQILTKHINQQEQILLSHDHKQFSIYFNTFNYISPNKIIYRYRLQGFDHDWQEVHGIPKATYTNLKAGDYLFEVQAIGPQGETAATRTLSIQVAPPWWNSFWFYCLLTASGLLLAYIVYAVVKERIRTKHQLKIERLEREKIDAINKMKTDFFTNISHEFKTPLTLILAPLEELLHGKASESTAKRYHELIFLNTKRLLVLVDQLLEFRKVEAGTWKLIYGKGNMIDIVQTVYHSFQVLAEKNQIKYRFRSTENNLFFSFDKDAVEKMCLNLLSNAFKYTPKGGQISLSLHIESGNVVLAVSDTGIGIDPVEQERVFEGFYQVDEKEMNLGSGIGLTFTKRLVELHGGTIDLQSERGIGSTFIIRLPITDGSNLGNSNNEQFKLLLENTIALKSNLPEDTTDMEIKEHQAHLLLVDDNPEIIELLQAHLSKKFQITTSSNGREAMELLDKQLVDLVISDVMMSEMDGVQFCKKLKKNINTCHVPVILLTAKNETEDQIRGLEAGADDYVTKPFSMNLLQAKVQSILKSRKRLKEVYSVSKEIVPENIAFNSMDEDFLRQAIQTIEAHLGDSDFSVDRFSKAVGMSRSNLYLKLKAITGESATDFIKRIRFKKAVELLDTRQYTVAQVAYMCGFNSPSYFSTAFKQYYDCMPTEYLTKKEII